MISIHHVVDAQYDDLDIDIINTDLVTYGFVNTSHVNTLPNYNTDKTQQYIYFLNNIPIPNASVLSYISVLYTINPAYASTTTSDNCIVRLHITRPDDAPNAIPGALRFYQDFDIKIPVPGVPTQTHPVYLQQGDIIGFTVPNDRIFLRFGANNQGLPQSYGSLTVSSTSSEVDRVGQIVLAQTGSTPSGGYDQLCSSYTISSTTTYGRVTTLQGEVVSSSALALNKFYFLTSGITPSGRLRSFTLDTNGPGTSNVIIVVGRPIFDYQTFSYTNIQWVYQYSISGVSDQQLITIPSSNPNRFQLYNGDIVGVAVTSGRPLMATQLSSATYASWSIATSSFVSTSSTPTYTTTLSQYVPKFQFNVDVTPEPSITQCSHGIWKKASMWPNICQFTQNSKVSDMFTNVVFTGIDYTKGKFAGTGITASTTLKQALTMGGGGIVNVYRQAVAAYMNYVKYGYISTRMFDATAVRTEFAAQFNSANPDGTKLESWATFCEGGVSPTTTPSPTTLAPTTLPPTTKTPTTVTPSTVAPTTKTPTTTTAPTSSTGGSGIRGDPVFSGFQGQHFQFHGLADEFFNLISAPTLQLNSHFVYLSSGRCDYTDTQCFSHPGTYLDELGFSIPSEYGLVQIRVMAGSHAHGLRVFMGRDMGNGTVAEENEVKPQLGSNVKMAWNMNNQTAAPKASVHFHEHRSVTIETPTFRIKVINSDYFFNLEIAVLDHHLLKLGAAHHTITDRQICDHHLHAHQERDNSENDEMDTTHASHDHGLVEKALFAKYGVDVQLHGLIGQTWRNVLVCGKNYVGVTNDYIVSDLFGTNYFYNFFQPESEEEEEKHAY